MYDEKYERYLRYRTATSLIDVESGSIVSGTELAAFNYLVNAYRKATKRGKITPEELIDVK